MTVAGTMHNFRGNPLRRGGPTYTFDLDDGIATVHVISFAKPPCESGPATVEGTFAAAKIKRRVPASYSFEEITALLRDDRLTLRRLRLLGCRLRLTFRLGPEPTREDRVYDSRACSDKRANGRYYGHLQRVASASRPAITLVAQVTR